MPRNSSLDWLELREITDAEFRSAHLAKRFSSMVNRDSQIIDLACGTGANARFLAPFLPPTQRWRMMDVDLTSLAKGRQISSHSIMSWECWDLSKNLPTIDVSSCAAITVSAFFDLVDDSFLVNLSHYCSRFPLLATMTPTGPYQWDPQDPLDPVIDEVLNKHRSADHGFGRPLVYDAVSRLEALLMAQGHHVELAESSWKLNRRHTTMLEMLINGVTRRVQSLVPATPLAIDVERWKFQRHEQLRDGELRFIQPHVDLFSHPSSTLMP